MLSCIWGLRFIARGDWIDIMDFGNLKINYLKKIKFFRFGL